MWFRKYTPISERIAKAQRAIIRLKKKKKTRNIKPVIIEGNKTATSWWGKAWIHHLKSYADYDNRVPRGRSYVKNGFVIHLAIQEGHIESMVMGSRIYNVNITMKKINKKKWKSIKQLSQKHLYSLSDLLDGHFPKELEKVFSDSNEGLFPILKEIDFNCSCPDWASMCKHVSATLFALGAKIDEDVDLFFQLRGVNIKELIQSAITSETTELQRKVPLRGEEVLHISDDKLAHLFDIKLSHPKKPKSKKRKKHRRNRRL